MNSTGCGRPPSRGSKCPPSHGRPGYQWSPDDDLATVVVVEADPSEGDLVGGDVVVVEEEESPDEEDASGDEEVDLVGLLVGLSEAGAVVEVLGGDSSTTAWTGCTTSVEGWVLGEDEASWPVGWLWLDTTVDGGAWLGAVVLGVGVAVVDGVEARDVGVAVVGTVSWGLGGDAVLEEWAAGEMRLIGPGSGPDPILNPTAAIAAAPKAKRRNPP